MNLKISSRQSPLAQIQAYQVGEALTEAHAGLNVQYLFRQSLGDQNQSDPLWKMPEKGVFTEDFYLDLAENRTDMVVHSWKDLPTEEKEKTCIAATLPREDQRDLLLFKKSSTGKEKIRIYSSSPRRTVNLQEFLPKVFPWKAEKPEFTSVRGNISTRVQKLLDATDVDGLIVAKAAMDRLLTDTRFPETVAFLRSALEKLQWMVLPLSENPNAAAQGALAIELNRDAKHVSNLLQKIHCPMSYQAAQREREILKEFGGGCHLALGMSVLERKYGRIEIVKGLTPAGDKIHSKTFRPRNKQPAQMKVARLKFQSERESLEQSFMQTLMQKSIAGIDAVFVSRAEAWTDSMKAHQIWAAGVQTWEKMAQKGLWVQGCAEGLGEQEDPRIDGLAGKKISWMTLSHEDAIPGDKPRIATYKLHLKLQDETLDDAPAFAWKSASEFLLALQKFPQLRDRSHVCGPGRTFDIIQKTLGSDQNIFVELSDGFSTII